MVNGHAIPDRYTLEPNSVIEKSESFPSSISILFSERPDPKVSYIHVSNSAGKRIDNNDFKITGEYDREGTVTVDKNLVKEGVYSVSWSTLSLDDGHVARGTYVIGVGSSLPANTVIENVTENNAVYSPTLAFVKIPIVIGQVYVLGFVFSQLFIWKEVHKRRLRDAIDSIDTEIHHSHYNSLHSDGGSGNNRTNTSVSYHKRNSIGIHEELDIAVFRDHQRAGMANQNNLMRYCSDCKLLLL